MIPEWNGCNKIKLYSSYLNDGYCGYICHDLWLVSSFKSQNIMVSQHIKYWVNTDICISHVVRRIVAVGDWTFFCYDAIICRCLCVVNSGCEAIVFRHYLCEISNDKLLKQTRDMTARSFYHWANIVHFEFLPFNFPHSKLDKNAPAAINFYCRLSTQRNPPEKHSGWSACLMITWFVILLYTLSDSHRLVSFAWLCWHGIMA